MNIDRAAKISECVAAIAVVLGIIFGGFNYLQERESRKERFTFDYSREFYDGDLHRIRSTLLERVSKLEEIPPGRGGTFPVEDIALYFQMQTQGSSKAGAALRSELLAILDYFNGALGCVEAELCDAELLSSLHRGEAHDLLCLFEPAMTALPRRGGEVVLLAGIRRFGESGNKC